MATQWFRRVNGEEVGPHSAEELKSLAQSGELLPEDLIWKDGLKEWVPARKVQGLFDGVRPRKMPPAPKPIPEVVVHAPGEHRLAASAGQTFKAGCFGALGAITATWLIGIGAMILVCGGGITLMMSAFNNDEDDANPVQRAAGNPGAEGNDEDANDEQEAFGFGEIAVAESVRLSVTKAEIGLVPIVSFIGRETTGEDPALAITFRVENTDERKIVRYVDNAFVATAPRLEDDAGNLIRGVTYPGTPRDAMREDLNPGDSTTHVEVFMIPPPATEYLILTVDFATFGSEGEAKFRIDVDEIEGWPVEE